MITVAKFLLASARQKGCLIIEFVEFHFIFSILRKAIL